MSKAIFNNTDGIFATAQKNMMPPENITYDDFLKAFEMLKFQPPALTFYGEGVDMVLNLPDGIFAGMVKMANYTLHCSKEQFKRYNEKIKALGLDTSKIHKP